MRHRETARHMFVFFIICFFLLDMNGVLLSAKEEDVTITREGERTRIVVKTEPSSEPPPTEKGVLKATAQGAGDLTYEATKASTDAMGLSSDIAAKGFSTVGNAIADFVGSLLGSKKET